MTRLLMLSFLAVILCGVCSCLCASVCVYGSNLIVVFGAEALNLNNHNALLTLHSEAVSKTAVCQCITNVITI